MSRIADSAMPMQMQSRCKAHAECRMQNALQNADADAELQIRRHSAEISNGLRARSAGPDLIQDAMRRGTAAHPLRLALAI